MARTETIDSPFISKPPYSHQYPGNDNYAQPANVLPVFSNGSRPTAARSTSLRNIFGYRRTRSYRQGPGLGQAMSSHWTEDSDSISLEEYDDDPKKDDRNVVSLILPLICPFVSLGAPLTFSCRFDGTVTMTPRTPSIGPRVENGWQPF